MQKQNLRNIAIIAHVDHGKTTLVDKILHHCRLFHAHQETGELILDNNDQERERGITILAKNVSVNYKGTKINIIDTPGHADFGGEVERVLNMADGVLLLVDAFEGPMPQTRYVLSKAIELGKAIVVVVNKVDKDNCRPDEVQEDVFDLMFNLDASEEQLDFNTVYGSAKNDWMGPDWKTQTEDVSYLLDRVLEDIPAPAQNEGSLQMQITSLDYSQYVGRMAIGRVHRGSLSVNQPVSVVKRDGSIEKSRVRKLYTFDGLGKAETETVINGDLCAVVGIENFEIGDTIADFEAPEGLTPMKIDEPTMSMLFTINDSPFFGKEGKFVTSRHLRDRLHKELEKNLALRVQETESPDSYMVFGRGVMHLSVLIESMRREGYEFQVGKPQVIVKVIDDQKMEPVELLSVDVPDEFSGKIIELVTQRKGDMTIMEPKGDLMHLEFMIPSRGIIGLRTLVLNSTAGQAIMNHRFVEYAPWKGELPSRNKGSLIVLENGTAIPYAMDKLKDRGVFFISPGVDIYEGQIIGEHSRENDLVINITKTKKLTNMRSSGADDKAKLPPPLQFSLEQYMEYVGEDEYLEITPESLRLRKIFLKEHERKRASNAANVVIK
ncbi:translational GTPase TypA [Saprospira sp. CCB-QB6]|uniref:translational GTPase TypA n=1 Tax=Saprospira sp. CCB-QB6 TaxID=3023936 RepID=UPI0023490884|nr:translational GTPase TypA [Saprospira sp. CCB-QB6]WCL83017.1 translational GTPase TypA [Saprospira sp. CCB-QB6]